MLFGRAHGVESDTNKIYKPSNGHVPRGFTRVLIRAEDASGTTRETLPSHSAHIRPSSRWQESARAKGYRYQEHQRVVKGERRGTGLLRQRMEALLPVLKGHPVPSVLVCALFFRAVDHLLKRLPVPKVVQQDAFRAWRWRNLSVSMVHSLLSGTWVVTCVLVWPDTLKDLHKYHTPLSYLIVCISTGYFAQDACDIIYSGHARGSWEFLLHHALVLGCFMYTLWTQLYVAGAVVALFVEVNSVTLHLRLLLKLAGAQSTQLYQINKVVNILTYVVFRLLTQSYLTWYIVHHYSQLDRPEIFLFCTMIMNIMIVIYFYRLLRSDFLPQRKTYGTQNGIHNNNSRKFLPD